MRKGHARRVRDQYDFTVVSSPSGPRSETYRLDAELRRKPVKTGRHPKIKEDSNYRASGPTP